MDGNRTYLKAISLEDSPFDFEIISERLIDAGYELEIARVDTSAEYLHAIQSNTFDMIFIDYNLPGFDAFEAVEMCKLYAPEVPVICISGSIGEIMAIELLKKGVVDYVLKDCLERLPLAVKRALEEAAEKAERKKAEEKLRRSEAELNFAQKIARMGSWSFNVVTRAGEWSKNMFDMIGLDPEHDLADYGRLREMVHPDDRALLEEKYLQLVGEKKGGSVDFRLVLNDGSIIWVQNNLIPVFDGDRLVKIKGVTIDITEKKLAERELIRAKESAEASDRLKTAFMNNVSHEIRTPLNSILGFSQIIADPDFSFELKEKYTGMLNESAGQLLNTVTNFIDISLLTSGNQKVFYKELILKPYLLNLAERFSVLCGLKGIDLLLEEAIDEDFCLLTDEVLLDKILIQLLDNAIKFTHHGFVRLGCKKQDDSVLFFVQDTGIGISGAYHDQILNNFTQEDDTSTRRYRGTGIGLSIVKGLVGLFGGKLWFESEKGKGSTFYFTYPLV